jgi:hypothetical protein
MTRTSSGQEAPKTRIVKKPIDSFLLFCIALKYAYANLTAYKVAQFLDVKNMHQKGV